MCLIKTTRPEEEIVPTREVHIYRDGRVDSRDYPRRSYVSSTHHGHGGSSIHGLGSTSTHRVASSTHGSTTSRVRHVYHSPRSSHVSTTYRSSQPAVAVVSSGPIRRSYY